MGKASEILEDKVELGKMAKYIFKQVDIQDRGYIQESSLHTFMNNLAAENEAPAPSKDDIEKTMKEINTKGDGKITFEEFKVLIVQILTKLAQNE